MYEKCVKIVASKQQIFVEIFLVKNKLLFLSSQIYENVTKKSTLKLGKQKKEPKFIFFSHLYDSLFDIF